MNDSPPPIAAPRAAYFGIFTIALAGVAYQVILTRIFSVVHYYHFAFAGISLAMLGLTVGAEKVYLKPERFASANLSVEWARAALGFTITSVLLPILFLGTPLIVDSRYIYIVLGILMLMLVIPFTYGGICVTLLLTRYFPVGRLYAADLIGAALGCMGIVFALFILDPITIIFILGACSAMAAFAMVRNETRLAKMSLAIAALFFLAGTVHGILYLSDNPYIGVFWAKGTAEKKALFERWNAFSRIRVSDVPAQQLKGWGFGRPQTQTSKQLYLTIDSSAGTVLTAFDGDTRSIAYLGDDVINTAYHLRPVDSVVIIGVGGGRDILSALYFGAKTITGIELNPAIIEALTVKFADFTGHLAQRKGVTIINAEARSWLKQHKPHADLVQISLIDTWAATAAGGLTLSENRLYTLEAWKELAGILNPKGMLTVSRWFDPDGGYNGEFYRLLSLAVDTLKSLSIPKDDIRRHILAFNANHIITVIISPTAFSAEEIANVRQVSEKKGLRIIISPDTAFDANSGVIASGAADKAFYDALPMEVTSPTDNRPFFFYMMRLKDIGFSVLNPYNVNNQSVMLVLLILLIGIFLVTLGFIIQPLVNMPKHVPVKKVFADLAYFCGIGLGFMLIEISQMQRLIVFLGHPVFGLSVVLFTLLLFGGLGSATVSETCRQPPWKNPLLLCGVLCVVGLVTPELMERFSAQGTFVRILVSVALLAPAGFFMGTMLPTGMIASARHAQLQPWFWGSSGAASVFASIFGMLISIEYGISATFWCGVASYVLCLILTLRTPYAEIKT